MPVLGATVHTVPEPGPEGGFLTDPGHRVAGRAGAGQRRLIALARAQLADPDVLLLDEATSALDPATEAAVSGAVARLTAGRTSLIVAHRLTTAARADPILVLADGAVAEEGTHAELLSRDGAYAHQWRATLPEDGREGVPAGR